MAPKAGKKEMTQEQLDRLAAAREKAKAVKLAMKENREEEMISILQAKIDKIKTNSTKKKKPETEPEPPVLSEPTEQPKEVPPEPLEQPKEVPPEPLEQPKEVPSEPPKSFVPDTKAQISEPYGNVSPPGYREKKSKKKSNKPLVLVQDSESSDDSEDNNVIYIRKPRKKKQVSKEEQQAPQIQMPHVNPFFSYNPMMYRNFQ